VRLLVDDALSPLVAAGLAQAGHDAVRVRDYGLERAADPEVFARAAEEGRVLVSADTDFGALLAVARGTEPSIIIIRRGSQRRPAERLALPLINLPRIGEALPQGCVAVFDQERIRIRSLPVVDDRPA
jgi:predicted nuclease of predicted toxin-antitoxin system